jgi:hypothetical protein
VTGVRSDLAVEADSVLVGYGKSTVLRAVPGLLTPADGALRVLGREVDERGHAFRAQVAGVLDDDACFPALTVAEHPTLTAAGTACRPPPTSSSRSCSRTSASPATPTSCRSRAPRDSAGGCCSPPASPAMGRLGLLAARPSVG